MKNTLLTLVLSVLSLSIFAQLQAPVLLEPADNATNVQTTAEFDWNPALGGIVMGYEFEVDVDSNFSNPWNSIVFGSSGFGIEMLFDTRYFWRVRAVGVSTTSDWSDTLSFTTHLNNFELKTPSDTTTIFVVNTKLEWIHLLNLKYMIQYDTVPTFNSSALHQKVLVNPVISEKKASITIDELYFGKRHYWRVRGFHSNDTSGWSDSFYFVTPETISISSLANNATNIDIDTALRAFKMLGVKNYELQLDSSMNINSASTEYYHVIDANPDFPLTQLLYGTTYYWQVRGINQNNTSPWSSMRKFTTKGEVTTVSPVAGATVTQMPNFTWQKIYGSTFYQLQVANDINFTNPLTTQTPGSAIEFSFPDTIGFGTKYWRIRAISSRDTSMWSPAVMFLTTPVGIENIKEIGELEVFPNPMKDNFVINLPNVKQQRISISISDVTGKVIYNDQLFVKSGLMNYNVDVSKYSKGIYNLSIQTDADQVSKKIIIQ